MGRKVWGGGEGKRIICKFDPVKSFENSNYCLIFLIEKSFLGRETSFIHCLID